MNVINEYHPGSKLRRFTDLDAKLNNYYDKIFDIFPPYPLTSRGIIDKRICFRDIFYYISFLYEFSDPDTVLDLGCGDNLFKDWFANIYSVDIESNYKTFSVPDEYIVLDDFLKNNKDKFSAGMAINSLHFNTDNIDYFLEYVEKCMDVIRPGGRFLFCINYSKFHGLKHRQTNKNNIAKAYDEEIYNKLVKKPYNIVLYDPIISRGYQNNFIVNGDLRFIIQK